MDDELISFIIIKIKIIIIITIIIIIIIIIIIKGSALYSKTIKIWWKIINNSANIGACY